MSRGDNWRGLEEKVERGGRSCREKQREEGEEKSKIQSERHGGRREEEKEDGRGERDEMKKRTTRSGTERD